MATLSIPERAGLWIALVVGSYLLVPDLTSGAPAFLAFTMIVTVEIAVAGADDRAE